MRISLEYLSYEKFKTEYSKLYGKTMFAIYATVLTPITQKKKIITIYREIGYCVLYSYWYFMCYDNKKYTMHTIHFSHALLSHILFTVTMLYALISELWKDFVQNK